MAGTSCAAVTHGPCLRDGTVFTKLSVLGTFHGHKSDFSFRIEMQSPPIRLGQPGSTHACHGLGEKFFPQACALGPRWYGRSPQPLHMDRKLDFLLRESVGLGRNEFVLQRSD